MSEQQPTSKRGWKAWQIIAVTLIGLAVTGAVGSCSPTTRPEPAATTEETVKPVETAAPTPTETQAPRLAETVWAQVLANFPGGITPESPLFAVTSVEDVSNGTIRVNVQEQLTDTERDEVARHVTNLGSNPNLKVVVVRDVTGIDSNHYV